MGMIYSSNTNIDPETQKKIIGPVLIAFGLIWFAVIAIIIGREKIIISDSVVTTGTVIGFEQIYNSNHNPMYKTQYTYIDQDGNIHYKTGNSASNPPEYEVGDEITVYYGKNNYNSAIYKGKSNILLYSIFGTFGTIFLLGGIFFTYAYRTGNLVSVNDDFDKQF